MAWAGFSIVTGGATIAFTGISLDEFGASPLPVYSDKELTTEVTTPLDLTDDPTVVYLDLGSTSVGVWLTFAQPDDSAINVAKQATAHVTLEVDPTPSYRQIIEDVSDITGAIAASAADLTLDIGAKADKLGSSDILIDTSSKGLVLTSPNGTLYRVKVTDAGVLTSSTVV